MHGSMKAAVGCALPHADPTPAYKHIYIPKPQNDASSIPSLTNEFSRQTGIRSN